MAAQALLITDSVGNIFPAKKYQRIVSLVPSLTEVLFTFGLEKNIVGVTKYCTFPSHARDEPRKIVGGTKNPNIQKIIDLKPDIVIVNQEENQLKHYSRLIQAEIPVFVTFPKTVLESLDLFHNLLKLFEISFNEELNRLDRLIDEIQQESILTIGNNKKSIFCPIWKNPWMTFNADTFASSILGFCGGENVFKNQKERYPEISIEEAIATYPDIILLPDEPYNFTESDKEELYTIFQSNLPQILLIDGKFHWYSILQMIKSLPFLVAIFKMQNLKSLDYE